MEIIILALTGVLIGASIGMTGSGGALIAVSILVTLLNYELLVGTTLSALVVCAGSISGALRIRSRFAIDRPLLVWFLTLGTTGNLLGFQFLFVSSDIVIYSILILLLFFSALSIQLKASRNFSGSDSMKYILLIFASLVAGFFSGLLGIGGGFILLPALLKFTNKSFHECLSLSLFVVFTNSLVSLISRREFLLNLQPFTTLTLITVVILTTNLTIGLGEKLKEETLKKLFSLVLVTSAGVVTWQNLIPSIS